MWRPQFSSNFEEELLRNHDLTGQAEYRGRHKGPSFMWRHPMQPCAGSARVPADQAHWRWMSDRIKEWGHLRAKAAEQRGERAATLWQHAHCIHVRLKRYCPPFALRPEGWEYWRQQVRAMPNSNGYELDCLITWLMRQATRAEAQATYARNKQWHEWARQETEAPGAKKAFRWIKDPPPWVPMVAAGPWGVASLQQDAEAKAATWRELWGQGDCIEHIQWQIPEEGVETMLPTRQQLADSAMSFPKQTALGVDGLHPRYFAEMSEGAYHMLMAIWAAMLFRGWVPNHIAMLLVVLLPKPEGGLRPIGLFSGMIRSLMHWLRDTVGNRWMRTISRPYWYGCKGKTIERCVWAHGMAAELAKATDQHAADILFDIQKAYESLRYADLWAKAVRHGFPLVILRLLLVFYTMLRVVRVGMIVTRPVLARNSAAAGCHWADLLMRLALIDILDAVLEAWPYVMPAVVADDIQLLAMGPERMVVASAAGAFKVLALGLQRACLPLAVNKLCLLATSPAIAAAIGRKDNRLARATTRSCRNLGMDFTCGVAARHGVRIKRIAKVRKWVIKIRRLRKAAGKVRSLVTQGVVPATTFGAKVTGAPWYLIAQARSLAHRALYLHTAMRSVTIDLALASKSPRSADPAYTMLAGPILSLASAFWESWVPKGWILRTWRTAHEAISITTMKWNKVNGPLSAALASARRLGWDTATMGSLKSKEGLVFDLCKDCPRTIYEVALRDAEDFLLDREVASHAHLRELGGRPWLAPLSALVHQRPMETWTPRHQGTLKAIAANGIWTQDRFFGAGMVGDDLCQVCGGKASLWHRAWEKDCPACKAFLDQYGLPRAVLRFSKEARHLPLWTHALLPDPGLVCRCLF